MLKLIQGRCETQHIKLEVDIPQSDLMVEGDAMQIQQVILNFCLNAMDAMPQGGNLRIRATKGNVGKQNSEKQKRDTMCNAANNITISVQDTGPGISESAKDLIYQPFFTTKPNGIGLGLGICQRIAKAHGGNIDAENNPNGGATFTFNLPAQHDVR
jgi:signal transduction histidine kinase